MSNHLAQIRLRSGEEETEMVLCELAKHTQTTVINSISEQDGSLTKVDHCNHDTTSGRESESECDSSDTDLRPDNIQYKVKHEIDHGEYTITHQDIPITVIYRKYGAPVGLMDCVQQAEQLILTCDTLPSYEGNKTLLEQFIVSAVKNDTDRSKDKIRCFVAEEGFWKALSKIPKRNSSSVFHPRRDEIISDIRRFSKSEAEYHSFGIPYKRNMLFYGPPGTGKTSMMTALASEFNSDLYLINFSGRVTDASFMRMIAKMPAGSILVLEDVDALFQERIANDAGNKSAVTFSAILNTLDGIARKNRMVTVMTTNHLDRLDEALIRPGRIDLIVEFKLATPGQITEMFTTYFGSGTRATEICREILAEIGDSGISTAALQKFFFEFRDNPDKLLQNKSMLGDLTQQYEKTYHNMYS